VSERIAMVLRAPRLQTSYRQDLRVVPRKLRSLAWLAVGIAFLLYAPTWVEQSAPLGIGTADVNFALIAIMGAVALNLLVGYTGLLSMGHAAFLALGAFGGGLLGVKAGLPFWLTAVLSGCMGAAVGTVVGLPSLRLRGLYLLLSTLALHFIALYLFLKYQIHSFGPAGISYPYPSFLGFTFNDDKHWYFLLLACAVLSLLIVRNLLRSREGRAFVAIRDSDVAAGAVGVNVAITKLKAFALSSFIVTFSGTLYAYYVTTVNQDTYTLNQVIGFYAMVIVGGLGSLSGAVYGALLYSFLPPILTQISKDIGPDAPVIGKLLAQHSGDVDLVIFGVVILIILMVRPEGLASLWGSVRRSVARWPYTS
jgi:branched-chain amino acid transport system permease protein